MRGDLRVQHRQRVVTPRIRRAALADAPALADLAARTFVDAFGADNTPEDLALHLAESYGPEQQARELLDPAMITLVAEEAGSLVAFAQLRQRTAPACVRAPAPIELQRFYVAADWHGRGLAHALMTRVLEVARRAGASSVWLGVWERNTRAIAFYRKSGYSEVGVKTFVLGTDRQTGLILTRSLGTDGD